VTPPPQATNNTVDVRLAPESVEAIARRVAELVTPHRQEPRPRRLLTAAEVSRWWGVERAWVYANADRLGARRLGAGTRPRLRFDPDEVAERLGAPPLDAHRDAADRPIVVDGRRSRPTPLDGERELSSSRN
jgi:hypothetical protein